MSWDKVKSEWQANITVDGKQKHLGNFEGNAHGEVEAALAYDTAARAVGRPETANLQAMAACAAAAPLHRRHSWRPRTTLRRRPPPIWRTCTRPWRLRSRS